MKNKLLLLVSIASIVCVVGCTEVKKKIKELVFSTTPGGFHPLTKPINDLGIAEKFIDSLENDFADGTVEWPKSDSGKYITSWYVDMKYIDSIKTELQKLSVSKTDSLGIRLYPVKNDKGKFSIMLVGNYSQNGKKMILKYKVDKNGNQNTAGQLAPMYEWIDPCPNNCPDNDFSK